MQRDIPRVSHSIFPVAVRVSVISSRTPDPIVPKAIYKGTVNDPTPFPPSSKSQGSYHWAFERLLSAGLVPLTAAAFVTSGSHYPVLDGLLGISLIMHSHMGVRDVDPNNPSVFSVASASSMPCLSTTCINASFPLLAQSQPGLSGRRRVVSWWESTSSIRTTSVCFLFSIVLSRSSHPCAFR